MKRLFFPRPAAEEDVELAPDALQQLRGRILNHVLLGVLIFGLLDYFLVVVRSFERTPRSAFVIYTLAIVWLLVITLAPRLPYRLRALSLIGLAYVLGLTNYLQSGVTTDGAIFMLAFVFLATLFFGGRGGAVALGLGAVSAATVGFLMSRHLLTPTDVFASDDWSAWINRSAVLALVGVAVALPLSVMIRGLQAALQKALTSAARLEQDQATLRYHAEEVERRSTQIRNVAEIVRLISGVRETESLLQQVVNLIQERFQLYYAGVFLLDESRRYAVLRAGTGEAGAAMLAARHRLSLSESSMVGWAILNRKARIALDVGQEAVRFANPYLPATRSELALPLVVGERAIGALTIQSDQPEAFDEDDITIMQNIADTLAIALENARLFAELEANLEEIRTLHGQYVAEAWSRRLPAGEATEYTVGTSPPEGAAVLDVPLTLRDQIIGQITLEGESEWSPEERSLIEAVATQAALALENARLLEESQQMALHERLTAEITRKVWASQNIETILQTAVRELGRALRAEEASIHLELASPEETAEGSV
jgi:GAF domain-containing protein